MKANYSVTVSKTLYNETYSEVMWDAVEHRWKWEAGIQRDGKRVALTGGDNPYQKNAETCAVAARWRCAARLAAHDVGADLLRYDNRTRRAEMIAPSIYRETPAGRACIAHRWEVSANARFERCRDCGSERRWRE